MASQEVPAGVRFVWGQAERRLEAQLRQADALDTKAGALVGLHAVAAGLSATILGRLSDLGRWVAVAAILGLVVSGWFAFRAFRSEAYDRRPAPEEMWRFGELADDEIRYRLLASRFRDTRGQYFDAGYYREARGALRRSCGTLWPNAGAVDP